MMSVRLANPSTREVSLPHRSSITHPLRIDVIDLPQYGSKIGLTLCPGKIGDSWLGAPWRRDLETDLDAIAAWGAVAVVTLIERHEFEMLGVQNLGQGVLARGMQWFFAPIVDRAAPDLRFENAWIEAGATLRGLIKAGSRFVIHCRGGLGRAGTVAARLLIETGTDPSAAIALVRAARPGAIETKPQERYVLAQRPISMPPSTTQSATRRQQPQVPVAR